MTSDLLLRLNTPHHQNHIYIGLFPYLFVAYPQSYFWVIVYDLQNLLELKPKIDVLFIIVDWNAKVGSQELPRVTGKFGLGVQNEAGPRLTQFCQENTLVIVNTLFQQHKRQLYIWTSPDGQYQNLTDYIFCN